MRQLSLLVPFAPKPIHCILLCDDANPENPPALSLIFTHGAGGSLTTEATAKFIVGFASQLPMVCFQGSSNLKSRTNMFGAVIEAQGFSQCLGGRSMGARAAVMAVRDSTTHLILVSYPLHTNQSVRDEMLLDLAPEMKVIFVSGDRDDMCDLQRLEAVRARMSCKSWRIVVQDANHGMNIRPKAGSEAVVKKSGEVVAGWINGSDDSRREGRIFLGSEGQAEWSGWLKDIPKPDVEIDSESATPSKKRPRRKAPTNSIEDRARPPRSDSSAEAIAKRTRKRRKS